jgi:transcriptional regulator of heat shock response
MLTERQKDILKILTNEYIKEFSPISSNYLVSKCGLDFSSATIRNELSILEDSGYLKKNYYSSGSIPTNKAYEFLVNEILQEKLEKFEGEEWSNQNDLFFNELNELDELSDFIASKLKIFNAIINEQLEFYYDGVEELFASPDFQEKDEFLHLAKTIDLVEDFYKDIFYKVINMEPMIFIGKNNPFNLKSDLISFMTGSTQTTNEKIAFILIGPSRMPYKKNWLFLNKLLNNLRINN